MEHEKTQNDWSQVAEIEVVYKTKIRPSDRPYAKSSNEIFELLSHHWNNNLLELQEQFCVLLLNRRNRVLGLYRHSSGGIANTVADTRLILAAAIKAGASSIVLAHNHPSGELKPSRSDEALTQKLKAAAAYHDINVLDHIILGAEGYFSMSDEGLL